MEIIEIIESAGRAPSLKLYPGICLTTCFGHYYAYHQELATIMLITTLIVSFCKDGRGSDNVKLWFLVVCVRCEVLCRLVVAINVFLLILLVVILCVW